MVVADDDRARVPRMRASDRRSQLIKVAAERFHRLGYHGVSLGSVATEVGLTGPALYRHFRNKQGLLAAAIASGLDIVEDALLRTTGGTLDQLVAAVAAAGLERPDLWVLLQRESHYLDTDLRTRVDAQFARVVAGFVERLRQESPSLNDEEARLLVTAAMAVLALPATVAPVLPNVEHRREIASAALACLRVDLSAISAGGGATGMNENLRSPQQPTRRSDIVEAAIDLFFVRGFAGVSLDDIGVAVGMAGPSILHYFPSKSDILVEAFDRATSSLSEERTRMNASPARLSDYVDSYVRFCLQNRQLVGVYVFDAMSLPTDALQRLRKAVRRDVAGWTAALQADVEGLDDRRAKVRVQAAMGAIHDLVRLGHFASRPRIADELDRIAHAILLR